MSPGDRLDADALRAALSGQRIGHRLLVLEETTSTNDVIADLAASSDEGVVVLAEHQTAGRGQYGRRWESAARKGLWLSVLLRPAIAVADSSRLTDLLAQTISRTIAAALRLEPTIKPPNDVYLSGRKVAGVLVEMKVHTGGRYFAVAGAGVNVNHEQADFPPDLHATATSLALASGKPVDRTSFAIAFLRELEQAYAAFTIAPAVGARDARS